MTMRPITAILDAKKTYALEVNIIFTLDYIRAVCSSRPRCPQTQVASFAVARLHILLKMQNITGDGSVW